VGTHCYVQERATSLTRQVTRFVSEHRERDWVQPSSEHTIRKRRPTRWKGNMKVDLTEVGCKCVDWIHVALDRDWWRALMNF
jgi:hypothetical protein